MAIGKNKRLNKKGKHSRKKKQDSFEKKEWFKFKLPKIQSFKVATYGWTPANKTASGVLVESRLQDRVATIRLGDLEAEPKADNPEILSTSTNLKLRIAKTTTADKMCWLDFHGLELTRDKQCSMIKKWVSLIEAYVDIKTTDGIVFRCFGLALTKKQPGQVKNTAYAQTSQTKRIRAKMIEIMREILSDKTTKEFVGQLLVDKIGDAFKQKLTCIFPIHDACVRKVKLIKRPGNEDTRRIEELHDDRKDENEVDED